MKFYKIISIGIVYVVILSTKCILGSQPPYPPIIETTSAGHGAVLIGSSPTEWTTTGEQLSTIAGCACPTGGGNSDSEPDTSAMSFDEDPSMDSTSGPGQDNNSGNCERKLSWNVIPQINSTPFSDEQTGELGNFWQIERPRIINVDSNKVKVRFNGHYYREYNTVGSNEWKGTKLSIDQTIRKELNNSMYYYKLYDQSGKVYVFEDSGLPTDEKKLLEIQGAGNDKLTFSYNNNLISEVQYVNPGAAGPLMKWSYFYDQIYTTRLIQIQVFRGSSSDPFRVIDYNYMDPGTYNSDPTYWEQLGYNIWSLMGILDKWEPPQGSGESGWKQLDWIFRYYTNRTYAHSDNFDDDHEGYQYQLRAVINPNSVHRFQAENPSIDIYYATLSELDPYMDKWIEYHQYAPGNPNSIKAKNKRLLNGCSCQNGEGVYSYAYSKNYYTPTYLNEYEYKVTVTMPTIGTATHPVRRIWYNTYGQKIAETFTESNMAAISSGRTWSKAWIYDQSGFLTFEYTPESVNVFDDPDGPMILPISGGIGYIYFFGDESGFKVSRKSSKKVLSTDNPILISENKYIKRTIGNRYGYYLVSSQACDSLQNCTIINYTNTFYDALNDDLAIKEREITHPSIQYTDPIESRSAVTEREHFKPQSCLKDWHRDTDGFVTHYQYDSITKELVRSWSDINTSNLPQNAEALPDSNYQRAIGLPAPVSKRTDIEYDSMGRIKAKSTKQDPWIDQVSLEQREEWVYSNLCGGEEVTLHYQQKLPNELPVGTTNITVTAPWMNGKVLESGLAYLNEAYRDTNVQDDWDYDYADLVDAINSGRWTFYLRNITEYTSDGKVASVKNIKTPNQDIAGDYYETSYDYDSLGRNYQTINAVGTYTISSFDDLGRIYNTSVKSQIEPAYVVESRIYDLNESTGGHGVGNGKISRIDRYTGVTGDATRKTWMFYDYLDRSTHTITQTGTGKHRVELTTYSATNPKVVVEVFDSTTVYPPTTKTPATGERRSRTAYYYDSWKNVYENRSYGVNQTTGAYNSTLYAFSRSWRNGRNMVIKSISNKWVLNKSEYDGMGRIIKSVTSVDSTAGNEAGWDPDYLDDIVVQESIVKYDVHGHLIESLIYDRKKEATDTELGLLTLNLPKAKLSASCAWYDELGRTTTTALYGSLYSGTRPAVPPDYGTQGSELITAQEYNEAGWLESSWNPEEHQTAYVYDGLGQIASVTENVGTSGNDVNRITSYEYNGSGKIKRMIAQSAAGAPQITEYYYGTNAQLGIDKINSNDLLVYINYPDPTTGEPSGNSVDKEEFHYNRQGELIYKKDQNGTIHSYGRDLEGRVLSDYLSTVGSGVDSYVTKIQNVYDGLGRTTEVTSWQGTTGRNGVFYDYGDYGQVTTVTQNHTGTTKSSQLYVLYSYLLPTSSSKVLRLSSTRYPNGTIYTEQYSGTLNDRLSRATGKYSGSVLFTDAYEGIGRRVGRYLGTGTTVYSSRARDEFGRFSEIRLTGGSFGTTESNSVYYTYCYNRNSQAVHKQEMIATPGMSENYQYDGLMRLTEFRRGPKLSGQCTIAATIETQSWTMLDHSNNWGSQWNQSVNKSNEITNPPKLYDNNGNMLLYSYSYFTYDGWNRLVTIIYQDESYLGTFRYNGLNQLISQQSYNTYYNNSNDRYYYGADWRLLEERKFISSNYYFNKHFIWGNGYIDDLALLINSSAVKEYYIQDANWNTVAITTNLTSIKERYRYYPYGTTVKLSANWANTLTINDDIPLYTGQRYNWLNALYNYRNRYYYPSIGRFLQRDPIGIWGDGVNFGNGYGYVGEDPVNRKDSYGFGDSINCKQYAFVFKPNKNRDPASVDSTEKKEQVMQQYATVKATELSMDGYRVKLVDMTNSISDINKALRNIDICSCVALVIIVDHGGGGGQVAGNNAIVGMDDIVVAFKDVKWCDPCQIQYNGCGVGGRYEIPAQRIKSGPRTTRNDVDIPQETANFTKCNVKAARGNVSMGVGLSGKAVDKEIWRDYEPQE